MVNLYLYVLDDNQPSPGLLNKWGWSVYIEKSGSNILFDTDTDSNIIISNAEKLGVSLEKLDYAFLSHHHGDHSGGFEAIGRFKPGLPIYVPPGDTWYLERYGLRPVIVKEPVEIAPGEWSTGPLSRDWIHEHGLIIRSKPGPILIVGCSHPGIDRLVDRAVEIAGGKLFLVIGGFHSPPRWMIDRIAPNTAYIAPAHCSGEEVKQYVKTRYGEKYVAVRTGTILRISESLETVRY